MCDFIYIWISIWTTHISLASETTVADDGGNLPVFWAVVIVVEAVDLGLLVLPLVTRCSVKFFECLSWCWDSPALGLITFLRPSTGSTNDVRILFLFSITNFLLILGEGTLVENEPVIGILFGKFTLGVYFALKLCDSLDSSCFWRLLAVVFVVLSCGNRADLSDKFGNNFFPLAEESIFRWECGDSDSKLNFSLDYSKYNSLAASENMDSNYTVVSVVEHSLLVAMIRIQANLAGLLAS